MAREASLDADQEQFERWQWRFFPIWASQVVSQLGSQLVQFALIWHLASSIGSATALTIATLAGVLPQVALERLPV